ncbi:hypothetical protein F511_23042 [Dorcoceras hygrometricum]|uniref:Maternal effect embryo arrest 22 n=1 Tax=Dorcoceras hygrometricum TaxID=472368 RepID=A0A2Z7CK47_9LAMI|nr:hypothetical protein F511_23042 [Dorcoceras hygrometricum]
MAADAENVCCAAWKKKYAKILEKYSKVEELKNKFRDCTSLVNQQYDVIEKENERLKQELGNLKAQEGKWKDEKEQEYSIRVALENEISILKKEIQLLQQNGKDASNKSGRKLQERLDVAELQINQLKELLEKERHRADLEKKNAEVGRKKANEALKKLEAGKDSVREAQKAVDIERKKAEENKVLYERLKLENDAVKSKLCVERSKTEAANKRVEDEKQHTIRERKMTESAVLKAEEQRKLAETNLKKAIIEKDRADDLDQKLKEEKLKTKKLEEELLEYLCARKLGETRIDLSKASIESVLRNDVGTRSANSKALMSQGIEKMVKEKDQFSFREKKRDDSEVKKVVKHKKVAEAHKRNAVEELYHVGQLARELEDCKQILEGLQKRQQISGRTHVFNPAVRENSNISDRATVKLLKKQKKLEKMLVKHANEVTKVDVRNSFLHQELFLIKKRFHQFQQRLDLLDFGFVHGGDIIHELEKAGNDTLSMKKRYTDGFLKQLVSGIDSRLEPLYGDSYQKMSKSSALNSSTASFTYLPLMGSQERGDFSVTTSAKPGEDVSNLKSPSLKLSCDGIVRYRENVTKNAEKGRKGPIKGNADNSRISHCDKRKILGAVDSMDKLYSKGQKLHEQMAKQLSVFHDILNDHKDDSAKQYLPENFCTKQARPTKRRKTSCEETKISHSFHNDNGRKGMLDSDINNSHIGRKASSPGLGVRKCIQCVKDGVGSYLESTKCDHREFDEITSRDYMKLLELDNSADERSYCTAIAMPISPSLPEITFLGGEATDTDDNIPVKDNLLPTSGFNTFAMEKNCNHPENLDVDHESGACYYHNQARGEKFGMPNLNGSESEKTHLSCESSITSITGAIPNYFVFSLENKDNGSISRILQAIIRCKPQCTPIHSADVFLQRILLSLEKAEDLSSKEKVCAFFSIIVLGISEIETKNLANFFICDLVQSLDSVTLHICSALSDLVVRGIFMESCDLFDLLALIEEFLLKRKVLVCCGLSPEAPIIGSSYIQLVVNGGNVILSEQAALTYQLVAGGCLLASLCATVDHIGLVCATSCELFAMPKFDPAMVLAILHSFAHFCGSKYFTLQPYSLAMTVVKSLVMALEKQASSSNIASTFSSMVEMPTPSKTWSCCTNCLFSENVVSMEVLASLLLENLQKYSKSSSLPHDSLDIMKSFLPRVLTNEEITNEVSSLRQAVSLTATSNEILCNFVDVLSLVEIIAHLMKWEWTCNNILGGLFEILESCAMESFHTAIIVLLNQLGRLGVDSNGYEDAGVKKLRERLFAFFCESTSRNLSIPVQFAAVTALLALVPVSFQELTAVESQSILSQDSTPADFIRKWFSLLSKEQQLSFRLHQTTGTTKS